MLTSLDFLKEGEQFPPICEKERLQMYASNKALFESKHVEVYHESLERIERIIGNFGNVISYPIILNFQKLMSLKIADLLLGEPPQISAGEKDSPEQKAIEKIIENSDLINTVYSTAIDISRYGDGLLYVRTNGGKGVIDLTQPCLWYPIVSADNLREVTHQVIGWIVETVEMGEITKTLKIQVHTKGSCETKEYRLISNTIGKLLTSNVVSTGLTENAIVQISNIITSDRVTGIDDYTDIDSIIAELMVRVGQIARILDKHASPSVSGPSTALERDAVTGEWRLKMGGYFSRDTTEDPDVKYITWDGQLAANFTQIEKLTNFLYTISEMGSALFGDMSASAGQIPSGSALRRLLISPLAKVNRIRMRLDKKLKQAIILCSQLGGTDIIDLSKTPITITWQDGLPGDPVEESTIMTARTANKATMSQYRALRTYDAMSEDDADEELARIQDEESASNPISPAPFSNSQAESIVEENK